MMKINGYDVKPGDKLWHVLLGEGTVTELTPEGGVRVTFGTINYVFGTNRRRPGEKQTSLYWQNPVLIDPPPITDAPAWVDFREMCAAFWAKAKSWVK